jgi:mRNA interferase RelE/StbE
MAVRVEVIPEVVDDLEKVKQTGRIREFLAKLVRLEDEGSEVGEPLGHRGETNLTGWRKIVVGDRNWRIVFQMTSPEVAMVGVIGDRADAACYLELAKRLGPGRASQTLSLAAALTLLFAAKQKKPRRRLTGEAVGRQNSI